MRVLVFCLFFGFATPLRLGDINLAKIADRFALSDSFALSESFALLDSFALSERLSIKQIIEDLLKSFEGSKTTKVDLIEIDDKNRLEDIVIKSELSNITIDMNDNVRKISIKNITIPISSLDVSGEYSLETSILDLPIYGQGDIIIRISDMNIFFSLEADFKLSRGWAVKDIRVDSSVKYSLIKLDNLMNGEPMGDFLNYMMNELFKVGIDLINGLVEENKDDIKDILSKILNLIFNT